MNHLRQILVHARVHWKAILIETNSIGVVPSAADDFRLFVADNRTKAVRPSGQVAKGTQSSDAGANDGH